MTTPPGRPDTQEPSADEPEQPALQADSAAATDGDSPAEPTLAELLTGSARGETAALSAFYEATADVVYGLAVLMHADQEGAHGSTVAVYRHLWDQADARARDLRLQTKASQSLTEEYAGEEAAPRDAYRPNEYEQVLEWLVPLAHRIFVERFREGVVEPIPLTPVPQSEGGGVAGLPEEVIDDLLELSDSQVQSLALTYLSGMSHQQVAETVDAAVPSVKSRLRDAMTRLHSQRSTRTGEADPILRAAVTKRDVELSGAVNRNFTQAVDADLDKGLLVELAELYALDALDDAERALLDEKALTAEPADAQQWDTRVLAARRTLAEIFTSDPIAPPSNLLEDVVASVGEDDDDEIGVGLVQNISSSTGETPRRTPVVKRWMLIAGFAAVVLIGIIVIWIVAGGRDIEALAESDPEAHEVTDYEMTEGGQIDAVLSPNEDVGYAEFTDVPELEGDDTYQLWMMPAETGAPSSIGNFTAEELEEDGADLHDISEYSALTVTVESIRGEERPTGDVVAEFSLQE